MRARTQLKLLNLVIFSVIAESRLCANGHYVRVSFRGHRGRGRSSIGEMWTDRAYAALDNPQEYLVHDFGFHRAVAAASGNPILATFMEMVADILYQRRCKTIDRSRDLRESVEMHRKIYRAIRARNADQARAAMSALRWAQRP